MGGGQRAHRGPRRPPPGAEPPAQRRSDWSPPAGWSRSRPARACSTASPARSRRRPASSSPTGRARSTTSRPRPTSWLVRVEVFRALEWSGDLRVDDPDGIVVDAGFFPGRRLRSASWSRPGSPSTSRSAPGWTSAGASPARTATGVRGGPDLAAQVHPPVTCPGAHDPARRHGRLLRVVELLDHPELAASRSSSAGDGAEGWWRPPPTRPALRRPLGHAVDPGPAPVPDGRLPPGSLRRYAEVSQQVHDHLRTVTPLVEGLSLDEAFLDVAGAQRLLGERAGHRLAPPPAHRRRAGPQCSVGVAPRKLMAKLASEAPSRQAATGCRASSSWSPRRRAGLPPPATPCGALWGVGPPPSGASTASPSHRRRPRRAAEHPRGALGRGARAAPARPGVGPGRAPGRPSSARSRWPRGDLRPRTTPPSGSAGRWSGWPTPSPAAAAGRAQWAHGGAEGALRRLPHHHPVGHRAPAHRRRPRHRRGGQAPARRRRRVARRAPARGQRVEPRPRAGAAVARRRRAGSWSAATGAVDAIRDRYGDDAIVPAALAGASGVRVKRRGDQQWGPGRTDPTRDPCRARRLRLHRRHPLPALKALAAAGLVDAAVVATCDRDRTGPRRSPGPRRRPGHRRPRPHRRGVDAVWVCTPTADHLEPSSRRRRRVAVFCEKPLAPTLAEAEA